jgi:hypothetical protein
VKIGTEDKKKTMIAVVLFVFAVLAVMYELWPSSSTPEPATRTTAEATAPGGKGRAAPVFSKLDPSLRLDLLKGSEDVSYSGSGRDIFHSQAAPEPDKEIEKAPDPRKQAEAAPTGPPPKPPIPLKFYGFASTNNKKQIFLAQGEDIFVAKEGDIVKGRYKVLHVNDRNVEIEDVLGNYSQQIPLTFPNT